MTSKIPAEWILIGAGLGGLVLINQLFYSRSNDSKNPPVNPCSQGYHFDAATHQCVPDPFSEPPVYIPPPTLPPPTTQPPPYEPPIPDPGLPAPVEPPVILPGPLLPKPAYTVTTLAGLLATTKTAGTGEAVMLKDGVYDGTSHDTITGNNGVIVMAEVAGKTQIKGIPLNVGAGLIFTGFDLMYSVGSGDYVNVGANARFTRNKVHFANLATQKWLVANSDNTLIDHNEIFGKTTQDCITVCYGKNFRFMFNYVHDQSGAGTPAEAMRIGNSTNAWTTYNAEVAWNRWERISGETEMVTYKGSYMNIHHNTVIDCDSSPTFRHGNFKQYTDNIHINSGGVRFYGHGHTVRHNQFIDCSRNQLRGPIMIGLGDHVDDRINTSMADYAQVRDSDISQNMIISNDKFAYTHMLLGFGTAGTFPPKNNTIQQNIIVASKGVLTGTGIGGSSWADNTVSGNILFPTGTASIGNMPASGYTKRDPLLIRLPDGSYMFGLSSPLKWTQTIRLLQPSDVGILAP